VDKSSLEARVRELYEESQQKSSSSRYIYEKNWYRNVLFYAGVQWIKYNPSGRRWQKRDIKPGVPTPVTNKFASHAATMMQTLIQKAPSVFAAPAIDTEPNRAAAERANKFLPAILDEGGWDLARGDMIPWMVLTGNAFVHACYDNDPSYGTTMQPARKCDDCAKTFSGKNSDEDAKCPKCGSLNWSDDLDALESYARGKLNFEVFSPFEIYIDPELRSMDECQEVLIRRRYPVDLVRRRWGFYTEPDAQGQSDTTGISLLRAIAHATSGPLPYAGSGQASNKTVLVDQLWKRPSPEYPKGVVALFTHGELRNAAELDRGIPYVDRSGSPIWPWHLFRFDRVPGRIYGRTPLDDVAPKQEQRNRLEALIQLTIARTASPHWLLPKNSGITVITGEPGQLIEYNPLPIGPGGAVKPDMIPGAGVPTSVIAWLEKIDSDMEQLAGTFDVLKGNAPPGVTAGTALRLLLDRAVTRFTPVIKDMEEESGRTIKDGLVIFQQFGVDKRQGRIQAEGKTWETAEFSNADVDGELDVIVEAGSAMPQTTIGFQAIVQDLANMGMIDPTNPETRYKILQRFGVSELAGAEDGDIKQSERENWMFMSTQLVPTVNPQIDNHNVHILTHKKLAVTPEFERIQPALRMQMFQHIAEHTQAMMPAPMMGAPMGVPGQQPTDQGAGLPPDAAGPPSGGPQGAPGGNGGRPPKANLGNPPGPPGEPGMPKSIEGVM
jgi:hypothetical protein